MATTLSQLLSPAHIKLRLQGTRRTAVIHEVAQQLEMEEGMLNFSGFYAELLARERLDTTFIGNQTAVPHARTDHVSRIVIAAGRSDGGILFENGNHEVRLLFVVGTPKGMPADYLATVGALCRLVKDASVRERLLSAETAEEFVAVIAASEKA